MQEVTIDVREYTTLKQSSLILSQIKRILEEKKKAGGSLFEWEIQFLCTLYGIGEVENNA